MALSVFCLCILVAICVSAQGAPLESEGELDGWRNAIFIPNPDKGLPHSGKLTGFRFYARRSGSIYMQIWRRQSGTRTYKLILSEKVKVVFTGQQTVTFHSNAVVLKGDHVGFYFPGNSIIPFVGRECIEGRGLYRKDPAESHLRIGATVSFSENQRGWKPCRKYAMEAIMDKGTMIGYSSENRDSMDEWTNAMFITDPTKPIKVNGHLVAWEFYARRSGTIYLQVYRPSSTMNSKKRFKLVGQTKVEVKTPGAQIINIQSSELIDVEESDHLGFYFPSGSIIPFDGRECQSERGLYHRNPSEVKVGSYYDFEANQSGWSPCRKYSYAAYVVESDD